MLYYPRTPLASSLADALQGKDVFSDAPNGLFLAAPRRTGKSTPCNQQSNPLLNWGLYQIASIKGYS